MIGTLTTAVLILAVSSVRVPQARFYHPRRNRLNRLNTKLKAQTNLFLRKCFRWDAPASPFDRVIDEVSRLGTSSAIVRMRVYCRQSSQAREKRYSLTTTWRALDSLEFALKRSRFISLLPFHNPKGLDLAIREKRPKTDINKHLF